MFESLHSIANEQELLKAFRPAERDQVVLRPLMRFPLELRPYLAWTEPGGYRVFLVFKKPGWKSPLGVVLTHETGSFTSPPNVCEWCRHHGPSDEVGLLTAMIHPRRWGGITLCQDLSCFEKLEVQAVENGQDLKVLVRRLLDHMEKFCREGLEIHAPQA